MHKSKKKKNLQEREVTLKFQSYREAHKKRKNYNQAPLDSDVNNEEEKLVAPQIHRCSTSVLDWKQPPSGWEVAWQWPLKTCILSFHLHREAPTHLHL
jgi:hypothetical protein